MTSFAKRMTPKGYIVACSASIDGMGPTEDEAWYDLAFVMTGAGIKLVATGDEPPADGPYVLVSDYHCYHATEALIKRVVEQGGNIAWDTFRRVACTPEEAEEAYNLLGEHMP